MLYTIYTPMPCKILALEKINWSGIFLGGMATLLVYKKWPILAKP